MKGLDRLFFLLLRHKIVMEMIFKFRSSIKLLFFLAVLSMLSISCNRGSSYVLSGRANANKQTHFNPVSPKSQPVPKKFIIKNGSKTYLGQVKPK
jgi:hypothetical protein